MTDRETPLRPSRSQDTPLQRLGATLTQCRKQRRLSQRALAASTGIHHTYISEIELGQRNITVLTLLRLVQALAIPASWLLAHLEPSSSPTADSPEGPQRFPPLHETAGPHDDTLVHLPSDPDTLLHLLGATLRQHRQRQGLTHKMLAARTGLDHSYLGQIERGERNASVLSLLRIAAALDCSVSSLLPPLDTSP